ncbi:GGDEF domain-containing protein [Neiella marina]|uniref:diguanylate cyclase n=1 Tax=Neiella marina TaxID=508461 RepID=A0A8J2U214_9GAMM|nr:GGDEF domain-containing protein [Neiella marina]GGA65185.1 GGDEF domain-containing protein [Neiella marina]
MTSLYFLAKLVLIQLALTLFFPLPTFASNAINAQEVIEELYTLKSADTNKFNKKLGYLKTIENQLTKEQRLELLYFHAYSVFFNGNIEKTIEIGRNIISKSKNIDLLISTHLLLGTASLYARSWETGLESLLFISTNIDNIDKKDLHDTANLFIPFFYVQSGKYEAALEHLKTVDTKTLNGRNKCSWHQLALESNLRLGISAPQLFEAGVEICHRSGEQYIANLIKSNYYHSESKKKPQYVISEAHFLLDNLDSFGADLLEPDLYATIAEAYIATGDFDSAEVYAKKSIEYKLERTTLLPMISAYYSLYEINTHRLNFREALEYYKKYTDINNKYLNEIEVRNYSLRLAEHKVNEIARENKSLADQNSLLKLEQQLTESEKENQQLFIMLLGTCLILLIAYLYKARQNQLRLKQLAEFDSLTGVYNRGHFTQLAKSALGFAKDSKQSASIVLFDLDLFKKINDTYGHACGDWVLKQVATVCQELTRKNDVFARVGGEEFCFLLLGCDSHTALDVAEKCRRAINAIVTKESGFDFKVSGSFGVSDNVLSGYELDRILADADEALYCSKSSGRNTVSLYNPAAEQTSLLKPDGSPATLG